MINRKIIRMIFLKVALNVADAVDISIFISQEF